jgi:hypothetical protein
MRIKNFRLANFCLLAAMITAPAIAAPAEMDKAFSAAFGHTAPYTATPPGVSKNSGKPANPVIYTPSGLVDVAPGIVALISKGKPSCDSCSGTLAIHYLKRSGHEYSLLNAWPMIGGATGQAVNWTARPDLEGGPAILATHDEIGPDCHQTYSQIIALTPDKPEVRANLLMAVHYDPIRRRRKSYPANGAKASPCNMPAPGSCTWIISARAMSMPPSSTKRRPASNLVRNFRQRRRGLAVMAYALDEQLHRLIVNQRHDFQCHQRVAEKIK